MINRSKLPWTIVEDSNLVILSFLKVLNNTIHNFNPTKVVMAYDDYVGNSFRKELYPDYKSQRYEKNRNDTFSGCFRKQKEIIFDILEHIFPVYTLKYKGYEADDVIASIGKIVSDDISMVIWSNDQDLLQIQQAFKNVKVYDPKKKDYMTTPDYKVSDFKSLTGDISDNIKGVGGIGKITAEKILKSDLEFIKHVASKPERYIRYKNNKKIIDLIDSGLVVPENLDFLLSQKKYFHSEKLFNFIKNNGYPYADNLFNSLNSTFSRLENRTNSVNRDWFYNRG